MLKDGPAPTDDTPPPKSELSPLPGGRWFWLALVAVTVAAGGWRAWRIEHRNLDSDEVYEVLEQTTNLATLYFREDGFPPLFRWLVGHAFAWTGHDMAARWFSLVAGSLTVAVVGLIGRRVAGPQAGLVAAALFALCPSQVATSQLGRAYALTHLVVALVLLSAWRLRSSDRWVDWIALVVASWLALATHYMAAIPVTLVGVLLLQEKRGPARLRAVASAVLLVAAGATLLPSLRADLSDEGEYHTNSEVDAETYAFTYLRLVTGESLGASVNELRSLTAEGKSREALLKIASWGAALATCLGILAVSAWRRLVAGDRVWLLSLVLAPPLVMLTLSSALSTGYSHRYVEWMAIPIMVVAGVGATTAPRRWVATAACVTLAVISATATVNRQTDPRFDDNNLAAVFDLIEQTDPNPTILAAPYYYGRAIEYAAPNGWPCERLTAHPGAEQNWDQRLPEFSERLDNQQAVWLITQWYPPKEPRHALLMQLAERIGAARVESPTNGVMLFRAEPGRPR